MDERVGSPLPISSLRLLVSPLQLVSGAIWQTVQEKIVSDYGMLEEFVSTVTDIVPELLTSEQRTQLILGLRARLVLELCRCEETANLKLIRPHLDRMEGLTASWIMEDSSTNAELSNSNFRDLIQNMLKNPEERENFFQNVFPEEFGPRYDEALCTLTWHFLSRLEKLLPLQTLQQVAFMLKDVPSALEESMKTVSYPRELQTLLGCQKELCQLDESGCSLDGACITSALSLHSINIIKLDEEEAQSEEMAVENVTQEAKGVTRCQENVDVFEKDCIVLLERLDDSCLQRRPVRPNRGLKMKMILLQEKKGRRKNPSQKMAASLPCIPSGIEFDLPLGSNTMQADTTPDGTSDEESVDSLKHPSYVAPVGRSSEDSLSDCSEDHSLMAPIDDKDLLVTFKEQRATQMKHAAANKTKTSRRRGLCCICKVHVKTDMEAHVKTHFPDGVVACPRCGTKFKWLSSLRKHLKIVCFDEQQLAPDEAEVAQSLYKCDGCEKAFRYKLSLDEHKRIHNQLYCDVCRRVLRDAETLARHKVSHTPFQCTLCEENFPIFKRLTRHYENVHQLSRPFKCHHCPKVFDQLRLFIQHEWKHTGQLPFQCPQCSKKFRHDPDLVAHQRMHTHEKGSGLCTQTQKLQSGILSTFHPASEMIVTDKAPVEMFDNDLCSSLKEPSYFAPVGSSSQENSLSSGPKNNHSVLAPIEHDYQVTFKEQGSQMKLQPLNKTNSSQPRERLCCICKVHVKSGVKAHMKTHFPDGVFACPRCDTKFKVLSSLKLHLKRICFDEQQLAPDEAEVAQSLFKCDDCEKAFRYKLSLDEHKRTHNQLYCDVCRRVLRDAETLARHKVSHTPFLCTLCEENFPVFKRLTRHYENVHQLSRPFKCHHCPKVFDQLRLFIQHEWKHTGQLPFQCPQCSKKFRHDPDLVAHQRVHTHEKRSGLCTQTQKLQSGTLSTFHPASEMTVTDKAPVEMFDNDLCSSLKEPSYFAPVGSSSQENSLSSGPKNNHSVLAPIEHEYPVTFKEQGSQMKLQPLNKTSSSQPRKRICCICKVHVKSGLKVHMKTHFPDGVFACPRCDTKFKVLTSLRLHLKRVCFDEQQLAPGEAEVAQSLYKCDECEKAFRYKLSLDKHKRTHNQLYCDICRRVLRDAETLARHKVSHTPFQCTLCEENFPIFKRLTRHYENVHQLSRPFKCHHCPKVFTKLRFYIRHEWKHTGQLPFQCPQCSMKFRHDPDLVSHLRVHTREKPFLCADCGKAFSCNSNLKRHINFIHSEFRDARRFSCTQCNKTFKEKGALLKHEQRKHLKQRTRHPCMYCGKMFSQSGMITHTMIHTGERPFKCTVPDCDKCFRSTTEVKNHVMRQHSMERPFTCNTCGKGFIKDSILSLHKKTHTGEKPHVCFICGKAFLKRYGMNRHIQLLHTHEVE